MPGSRKKQLALPYVSETQTLDGLKMRFIVTKIGACSCLGPLVRNGYLVRTPAERRDILRTDRALVKPGRMGVDVSAKLEFKRSGVTTGNSQSLTP